MSSLGMNGPFDFNRNTIDQEVSCTEPGNYALGYVNDENTFIVRYVGRSDSDVNSRLKSHLNDPESYSSFKFSYATSPKEAYEKECRNYHDFGGPEGKLNNEIHPDQPNYPKTWKCPVCGKQ